MKRQLSPALSLLLLAQFGASAQAPTQQTTPPPAGERPRTASQWIDFEIIE